MGRVRHPEHLKGALPRDRVKQAYIRTSQAGARKRTPARKLGVEGMRPAVLLEALRRAGATFADEGGGVSETLSPRRICSPWASPAEPTAPRSAGRC